jgi:hypothetical protein
MSTTALENPLHVESELALSGGLNVDVQPPIYAISICSIFFLYNLKLKIFLDIIYSMSMESDDVLICDIGE